MKRFVSFILTSAFFLSSCSNSSLPANAPEEQSSPSATPTKVTITPIYTETATQTPILTISTSTPVITPTFDFAKIITRTPSIPETCPKVADIQAPKFLEPDYAFVTFKNNEQIALDFLNQGGDSKILINAIKSTSWRNPGENNLTIKDITGDGVPEIIISPSETYVFGCQNGKYEILLKIDNEGVGINFENNQVISTADTNLDGTPELTVATYSCGGLNAGMCLDGWVYEWNGIQFATVADISMIGRPLSGDKPQLEIKNANNDKLLELMATGGILGGGDYYHEFPWRQETDTYAWNGDKFVLQSTSYSNPQFRYQVVQDADRATLNGEYEKAIKFYQNAIYGNYDWFSLERKQYIENSLDPDSKLKEPEPDSNEQPNLTGYSFYRIMVAYVLEGNLDEAQTAYERIHKNFAKGSPAYDYVLIANAFWNEYQSSQDTEKACGKAVDYATKHTDILKYLGSSYHNVFQDIMYEPLDICPFK